MRRSFPSSRLPLVFLLAIILSVHATAVASRSLRPPKTEHEKKITVLEHAGLPVEEDSSNLMGVEECADGNEECLKRREMSEVHLDYIYTQHHPKP